MYDCWKTPDTIRCAARLEKLREKVHSLFPKSSEEDHNDNHIHKRTVAEGGERGGPGSHGGITVVLMNYGRPDVLVDTILPALVGYGSVAQVIVSHVKDRTDFSTNYEHPKVQHRLDYAEGGYVNFPCFALLPRVGWLQREGEQRKRGGGGRGGCNAFVFTAMDSTCAPLSG